MSIKEICKYRAVWMGMAMLWIILFHTELVLHNPLLRAIKTLGYGGVDIFIFASGIGCYSSYLKDTSPLDFLRRRMLRLGPTYVPFIVVWIVLKLFQKELNFSSVIGNLFAIQGFTNNGNDFNWYLTCIIICYILTPYLASFIDRNSNKKNILLVIFFVVVSFSFWKDSKLIISITRLPIFIIGMIFEKNKEKVVTKKNIFLGLVCFIIGCSFLILSCLFAGEYLWNYGLWWYPFILIVPFCCYLISKISALAIKKHIGRIFIEIISTIGKYSFELYLVHILIFRIGSKVIKYVSISNNIAWLIIILLVIPFSIALKFVSDFIVRNLHIFDYNSK